MSIRSHAQEEEIKPSRQPSIVVSRGRIQIRALRLHPEHGFSDPRAKAVDETGEMKRHSQPLLDLAGEGFHWTW